MRTNEKKKTKIRENVASVLFMLTCILMFSWVVSAEVSYSDEREGEHDTLEFAQSCFGGVNGSIDPYANGDWYVYNDYGYKYGYYTFSYKTLSAGDNDRKLRIVICMHDNYGDYPLWYYNGKTVKSLKTNVGMEKCSPFYIGIYGPCNMKYKFSIEFHEAKNWECERNEVYYQGNLIDLNQKYHGSSCCYSGDYDYDWYELEIPSTGIMTFEMDRTPKNNHTIMIYNEKLSQLWQSKITSVNHISKNIKVKTGKVFIKIFGTNNDQYDFKITHKQTTNIPNKPKITDKYRFDKGVKVTWNNPGGIFSGYQFQYSKDEKFINNVISKWIGGKKTRKIVLKNLEIDKFYYFRIRTYNKVNGKTYYSAWSDVDLTCIKDKKSLEALYK